MKWYSHWLLMACLVRLLIVIHAVLAAVMLDKFGRGRCTCAECDDCCEFGLARSNKLGEYAVYVVQGCYRLRNHKQQAECA